MKNLPFVVAFVVVGVAVLVLNASFAANASFTADPVLAWEKFFDSGNEDWANGIAIDPDGNILVSGGSVVGPNDDLFRLIKYDPSGNELWHKTRNPGTNDWPLGLAIDWQGNSYTAGGFNQDFYTMKFDKNGNFLWEKTYNGGGDEWAYTAACDPWGNVYIAGVDFVTVKYDPLGNVLMNDAHPSLIGCAYDAASAPDGSIYIGGYSGSDNDCRVLKYDPAGTFLWNIAYGSGTTNDFVNGIAVDILDYVYFTGVSYVPPNSPGDIVTNKLTPNGDVVWQKTFDSGREDVGNDIAVDDHFVYVLGTTDNGTNEDLIVLRYDKDGNPGWMITKEWGTDDEFYSIVSDNAGNFYVAGESNLDLRVVKYHQDDFPGVAEDRTSKPILGLEVTTINGSQVSIEYALPTASVGTLSFYSLDGRLVKSFSLTPRSSLLTTTSLTWDARACPSGIYFARLVGAGTSLVRKVVLVK